MHAVLALNGGKDQQGNLSCETMERIDAAMEFAVAREAEIIIMVGGDAIGMRDYATENFPDAPEPIAESASQDTLEGAHITKVELLVPNDVQEADVFTSDFHEPRANWSFSNVLGNVCRLVTHPVPSKHIPPEKLPFIRRREQVQLAVSKLKLLGIGPDDDIKRDKRLSRLRYRGRENMFAQLLVRADGLTNIRRY